MYNNTNNFNGGGLFNSPFSSSNPLYYGSSNNNQTISPLDQSLLDSYNRMEALKQRQTALQNQQSSHPQVATVFTDIATETKEMGEDELNFVTSSQDYQRLYAKYQQEFSEFITAKFANEYIQSGNRKNT